MGGEADWELGGDWRARAVIHGCTHVGACNFNSATDNTFNCKVFERKINRNKTCYTIINKLNFRLKDELFRPQIFYRPHPKDGEGNIFTFSVSPHAEGGTPIRSWWRAGGRPIRSWWGGGYSILPDKVVPWDPSHQDRMAVPLSQDWIGSHPPG